MCGTSDALPHQAAHRTQHHQVDEAEAHAPARVARRYQHAGVDALPEPPWGAPTMRAACAVSKCADRWVAGAATPYFLRARFGGAAASASPRAAAVGRRPPAFAAPSVFRAGRVATFRSAPTRQALLQRVHEVDHLAARRSRVGRLGDLLAGDLLLDERLHPAAVRIGVRLGTEVVVRELIDELPRELDLGGRAPPLRRRR